MKNLYKILFEGENIEDTELIHFKDEWYPTNEDWHTMIMNMNNHAALHSIFNKISDIDKVVRCYIAANMIGYPKLKDYEYNLFHGKKWKNWLLWDEIELIQNENVPIPEEYQELINDLTEYDITGGVALRNQDLGELVQFKTIFDAIDMFRDKIKDITFSKIKYDRGDFHPNSRVATINFNNGSRIYVRITVFGPNKLSFKTYDIEERSVDKHRYMTSFTLALWPYIENVIVDPDYKFEYVSAMNDY